MKLSIVYFTYRPGSYDMLVDSLKNQTNQNYELIVVDDFLERRRFVERYLNKHHIKLKYIGPSKPKCFPELGYNALNAVNTGILASTGDVVITMTDYQWLPPDSFEKWQRFEDEFSKNTCVVCGGDMYNDNRQKDFYGLVSLWDKEWKGSCEDNGLKFQFRWIPEFFEMAYTAFPYDLMVKTNCFPECYDCTPGIGHFEPIMKSIYDNGGKIIVDEDNLMQMVNHRDWEPVTVWHHPRSPPKGSTELVVRENCFNLKEYASKQNKGYPYIDNMIKNMRINAGGVHPPVRTLIDIVRSVQKDKMCVAEVGVYDGNTTIGYIDTIGKHNGKLYAIDWFKGNITSEDEGIHAYNPKRENEIYSLFVSNIKKTGYFENMEILKGVSWEVAKSIPDESLDLCFIDGDHRYESVLKDIIAYLPKIKSGGIICGHDFDDIFLSNVNNFTDEELKNDYVKGKGHCGVVKAVHDIFQTGVNLVPRDSFWFVPIKRTK